MKSEMSTRWSRRGSSRSVMWPTTSKTAFKILQFVLRDRLGGVSFVRYLIEAVWPHGMKELRAEVEDVSQRNPKPAIGAGPSIIYGATKFGIDEARRQKDKAKVDLSQLIDEGNTDLRVIAVWGANDSLGQTVIIKGEYDNLKRSKKFKLYAWIRILHPFNPLDFLQCIMRQFYQTCFEEPVKTQEQTNIGAQILKKMGAMKQEELVDAFIRHVNENRYLIVLNDVSTIEDWDAIKEYFPNNNKGSRIIVSTQHGEVASLCAGSESVVSEIWTMMEPGSTSSETILGTKNYMMVTDENQSAGSNENMVRKGLTRIGTIGGALEESHLVGREKEKNDLMNLILKQDNQQSIVVALWGMGGLGKTTLIKDVYQSQELSGLFEKRSCVTIMRPFVLEDVLKSLAMQLDTNSKKVEELGKILERKRCLIVLDDLSSVTEWDMIIQSLPKMESASRIVITTREENIAKHCSSEKGSIYKLEVLANRDALDLFTKKVFKEAINLDEQPAMMEEAQRILKKCNGLPLAIVTIGGFLAKQPKTPMEWKKLNDHISAEFEMNPELGIIRTILMKSYDGLPYHLKSCFLYMSIFPEDYSISRTRMVHRWNAEGYSSEVRGKSTMEVADSYYIELLDRSMILPFHYLFGSRKGFSSCKLHDLMREISISKAMEENLVFRMEEGGSMNTQGTIRHLAISSNWKGDQSEFESTVDLSRIRSLTVFGKWKSFYISDKMTLLRVLDLGSTSGLVDHHLEPIGKLVHLKYLSLRGCEDIFHLPDSFGNLKQLQTLDIVRTKIAKMPQTIINLTKLQYIQTDNDINRRDVWTSFCCVVLPFMARLVYPGSVVFPRGLSKLKALHTLECVDITRGEAILQDIKRLTRLHKLAVAGVHKKNCQEFCSTLSHLTCLESLFVGSQGEAGLHGCLDGLSSPPKTLRSLKLWGALDKLPEWIAGLHNLVKMGLWYTELTEVEGTIQVLGKLPNLSVLRLWNKTFKTAEPCCFATRREALFPSLTLLVLEYEPGIGSVEFEEGTAPKLELLFFRHSTSFSGLSSLPSLKEVRVHEALHNDDMKDTRAQLAMNPNKPVLKFIA
ncbi:hypothetical protein HU200_040741 [Digitaria exilis]|uniref:NB-ARC domain-containing protein n=1 Tax=Digitaria exilis TaxID=1010633 RepID=A0A835BDY0_9POAL|nr:hypothetical protein HU200_040741 [Digitaria exilis]